VAVVVLVLVLVVVVAGSLVLDEVVVPPELCRLAPQAVARAAKPPIAPTRSNRRRLSCPDIPPSRYASGRSRSQRQETGLRARSPFSCPLAALVRSRTVPIYVGSGLRLATIPQTTAKGLAHGGLAV
jgi:hypothetical protein